MPDTDSQTLGTFIEQAFFGDPPPAPEISLRFFSTDEHPTELTELLGIEPTSSNAPNTILTLPDGTEMTSRHGSWLWVIRGAPDSLWHEGVEYMLSRLPEAPDLWQRLTTKYQADIFCEFAVPPQSCSFELPVSVMRALVQRNLPLNLDLTPDSPERDPND
ncbi:DUF4279 domain-containing protein [Verrucomicrobium sp. BvORR106]|uniref:DUF4279 domain-containing protein n=1 Tax=Verrucomicrobium sp. BvORR106 TaxID=1403819 RepID=UPI0005703C3B|nr:DUF4279 domain-containing protein [Verrucomicrobium sp. BvORR106]